jgi:hypothetical protein
MSLRHDAPSNALFVVAIAGMSAAIFDAPAAGWLRAALRIKGPTWADAARKRRARNPGRNAYAARVPTSRATFIPTEMKL